MRAMAFPAEVARFLEVEPQRVRLMIAHEKLPAVRLVAKSRFVDRIPVRGLHRWLLEQATEQTPEMRDFETFARDFWAAAERRPATEKG